MNLEIAEERLVVVSDLHLGSPASDAARHLPGFLDRCSETGWALCLNGDIVDLLQMSVPSLVADLARLLPAVRRFREAGGRLYLTIGNHDLVLEHLLADLPLVSAPFFNLRSGDQRIRMEHGHVHEPIWVRSPGVYEFGGRLGRFALLANADVYRLYERVAAAWHRRRKRDDRPYHAHDAAAALHERGFDTVVFGHTHLPEVCELASGRFVNSGDWVTARTYVTIDRGVTTLHRWPTDALARKA